MPDITHITFTKRWSLDEKVSFQLGECVSMISAICHLPIRPEERQRLLRVSLIKGAMATTAIEGNTLSKDEISRVSLGESLPESKKYQEIEVKNVLEAMNMLVRDVIRADRDDLVTPAMLCSFQEKIGTGLGEHFNSEVGRFRNRDVEVGDYRPPNHQDVRGLVEKLCDWLKKEFRFSSGQQSVKRAIIEAIVAHVYIEWIHPFGDGNGRTGRLVEFYILLRAGVPSVASHILSNHYNQTRSQYYRELSKAGKTKDLSSFIAYAVQGFRDGLEETLKQIQDSVFLMCWQHYIYEKFGSVKLGHREVFKRRRRLILDLKIGESVRLDQIPEISTKMARYYAGASARTISRDVEVLLDMELITKDEKEKSIMANTQALVLYQAERKVSEA